MLLFNYDILLSVFLTYEYPSSDMCSHAYFMDVDFIVFLYLFYMALAVYFFYKILNHRFTKNFKLMVERKFNYSLKLKLLWWTRKYNLRNTQSDQVL